MLTFFRFLLVLLQAAAPAFAAEASAIGGDEETAKLEAMFKAQNDYWVETKDTMAQ